ncbi:MAG: NYN domain-containing protein [Candidatus Omnitrophica bacterium]|nr:NYN domain-containing protein [Candidatus Omnitrophota bacterium]
MASNKQIGPVFLIDGYNLIKSSFLKKQEQRGSQQAIATLLRTLKTYQRKHPNCSFTLVFDGYPWTFPWSWQPGVKIIFSESHTADRRIEEILKKEAQKIRFTVVSNDREIQEMAIILGASRLSVAEFLDLVVPPARIVVRPTLEKPADVSTIKAIENELEHHYGQREQTRQSPKKNRG